jgi:hypothetical protein
MITRLSFLGILTLALLTSAGPASSSDVGERASSLPEQIHLASFFGRPYPYGYTGWGPCIRYVEVDTPHGPRLRRVRACGPIVRAAG